MRLETRIFVYSDTMLNYVINLSKNLQTMWSIHLKVCDVRENHVELCDQIIIFPFLCIHNRKFIQNFLWSAIESQKSKRITSICKCIRWKCGRRKKESSANVLQIEWKDWPDHSQFFLVADRPLSLTSMWHFSIIWILKICFLLLVLCNPG